MIESSDQSRALLGSSIFDLHHADLTSLAYKLRECPDRLYELPTDCSESHCHDKFLHRQSSDVKPSVRRRLWYSRVLLPRPSSPSLTVAPAINKPPSVSSAQVIRDAQSHFKGSALFQPWLDREEARKKAEHHNQRQKRRSWKQRQPLQVKMGHGGTLDPMATGVLILGVGNGTKRLGDFLDCTKSYDAVLLFGAATDSYDAVGKIVGRKPYAHVTKELVEEALGKFRGNIMQRPSIFSALKVNGKKMYEYARAGKEIPIEVQERPVEVKHLEMLEWMAGGTHPYQWPSEEAEKQDKIVADRALGLDADLSSTKRKHENPEAEDNEEASSKRQKVTPEHMPVASAGPEVPAGAASTTPPTEQQSETVTDSREPCPAPACRLRMTVTSGFYVRSLCHDLGAAVESLGIMSSLVRTRQGDFELAKNVLEYGDLEKGEDVWGPQVENMLENWQQVHADDAGPGPVQRPNNGSKKRDTPPREQYPVQTRERRSTSPEETSQV